MIQMGSLYYTILWLFFHSRHNAVSINFDKKKAEILFALSLLILWRRRYIYYRRKITMFVRGGRSQLSTSGGAHCIRSTITTDYDPQLRTS